MSKNLLTKRIIPCLDVKNGRVVKGVNFQNLLDAGDPVETAAFYNREGADELVFLDISASQEGRSTLFDVVARTTEEVFIPFTVGGGLRTLADIRQVLKLGADKISLNSPAIENPSFIEEAALAFGSQCVVVAIDAKWRPDQGGGQPSWEVYTHGGTRATGLDVLEWAYEAQRRGAGEILLTSMDGDGTQQGYQLDLTRAVADALNIPVIASGGAGALSDFYDVFSEGHADAALAASLFHYGTLTVGQVKTYLAERGIPIRMNNSQLESPSDQIDWVKREQR